MIDLKVKCRGGSRSGGEEVAPHPLLSIIFPPLADAYH